MTEALVASRTPYATEVEAGRKYWWCACGRSKSQPFCDGSHKGTGLVPMEYTAEQGGKLWFCGCKQSRNAPLCDGSHKALGS
jgi:CDGSH-type Zn-finger protein